MGGQRTQAPRSGGLCPLNKEETAKAERVLDAVEQAEAADPDRRRLYLQARWTIRELAFGNPEIDVDEIVFVRRHWPRFNHQCSHRVGEAQTPGANLCVLRGLSPDGIVRDILPPNYAASGIGRFDLSFDASRIVFPYAAPRAVPTAYGYGLPADLITNGAIRIIIQCDGGSNAVVGELWLTAGS